MLKKLLVMITAWVATGTVSPAVAQDPSVRFNGFGEWRYGRSDGNLYLFSDEDGDFRRLLFGLNVSAQVEERIRVFGQVIWDELATSDVSLDVAFAEYEFASSLRLRVGRMRVPFGTYAENLRIGVARPFFDLPQSVYGRIGVVGDHFAGVHLTGAVGSSWSFEYDAFGGGMDLDIGQLAILAPNPESQVQTLENLIGGHVALGTPIEGLGFSAAANTADVDAADGDGRHVAWLVGAEYVGSKVHLRGELTRAYQEDASGNFLGELKGWYGEAAYLLTPKLQLGVQYDEFIEDLRTPLPDNIIQHRGIGVGLQYWISTSFVVKAEHRWISDNALANPGPEAIVLALITGAPLDDETRVFLVGAQFSF